MGPLIILLRTENTWMRQMGYVIVCGNDPERHSEEKQPNKWSENSKII